MAMVDIQSLLSIIKNLKMSNPKLSITAILSAYGYGYKAVSKAFGIFTNISATIARLIMMLTIPGSPFSRFDSMSKWILSTRPNTFIGVKGTPLLLDFIYQRYIEINSTIPAPSVPRTMDEVELLLNQYVQFEPSDKVRQSQEDRAKVDAGARWDNIQ